MSRYECSHTRVAPNPPPTLVSSFFRPTMTALSDSHCRTRNRAIVRVGHVAWLSAALLLHLRGRRAVWKILQSVHAGAGCKLEFRDSAAAPSQSRAVLT